MPYAFFFDNTRCTGCRTCQLACKDYKDLSKEQTFRRVYDFETGECTINSEGIVSHNCHLYHVSVSCNHCENPACVSVCPTRAMQKDPATGLVTVDKSQCLGCGYCQMACPYDAPQLYRELGHTTKCDGCKDRIDKGMKPICVESCPLRALDFGDRESLSGRGEAADIAPLPSPDLTKPSLFVRKSPDAQPFSTTEGWVGNSLEVF